VDVSGQSFSAASLSAFFISELFKATLPQAVFKLFPTIPQEFFVSSLETRKV